METTIEAVIASLTNAGVAFAWRGPDKVFAAGCVVRVNSFARVEITEESPDASRDRVERALRFY